MRRRFLTDAQRSDLRDIAVGSCIGSKKYLQRGPCRIEAMQPDQVKNSNLGLRRSSPPQRQQQRQQQKQQQQQQQQPQPPNWVLEGPGGAVGVLLLGRGH